MAAGTHDYCLAQPSTRLVAIAMDSRAQTQSSCELAVGFHSLADRSSAAAIRSLRRLKTKHSPCVFAFGVLASPPVTQEGLQVFKQQQAMDSRGGLVAQSSTEYGGQVVLGSRSSRQERHERGHGELRRFCGQRHASEPGIRRSRTDRSAAGHMKGCQRVDE